MSSEIVPFYEAQLTPDGHAALHKLAAMNGVAPSVLLDNMLASYEPHIFDAVALKWDLAKTRAEFDAIVAREAEHMDLFRTSADIEPIIEAVVAVLVKIEKLRLRPPSSRLVDVCPLPPLG